MVATGSRRGWFWRGVGFGRGVGEFEQVAWMSVIWCLRLAMSMSWRRV